MIFRNSFKDKACEISASDSESFFNLSFLCEQSIQEEVHKTVSDLSCKQNASDNSYKNDSDISHKNNSDSSHEIFTHLQNSNTQENFDFFDTQFMSLEKLCKYDEILKCLINNILRL